MTYIEQLAQFELKTIQFDGVKQSYREAGQGPNLVILHGISSGSGSWIKQWTVWRLTRALTRCTTITRCTAFWTLTRSTLMMWWRRTGKR